MVRLIPMKQGGKTVWVEDAPTVCPGGHTAAQLPGTTGCPGCHYTVRSWRCQECGVKQYDDEHACRK
jgi:hypothetical protein